MGKLENIQCFLVIAEEGSMAAAARHFDVTTAAISRQLAKLEENLGVSLFTRDSRNVRLNSAGMEYYQKIKAAVDLVEQADRSISNASIKLNGSLKVIANRGMFRQWLLPRLRKFCLRYPKITVELQIAEQMPVTIEPDSIQVGVSVPAPEHFVRKKVSQTRYCFVASPEYYKEYGFPQKINDLLRHRFLQHARRQPSTAIYLLNDSLFHIKPSMLYNDSEVGCTLALAGMGIIYLHHYYAESYLKQGLLEECLQEFALEVVPLYMYWHYHKYLKPELKAFINFMRNEDEIESRT